MAITGTFDFFVQWHLTERCNLACRHCYQSGGLGDELSTEEAIQVVEEAAEMIDVWRDRYGIDFAASFNVTGGEPLLRNDLFGILGEIGRRGFDTFILTNGTLVDRENSARLTGLGVRGVQVSLEGPEDVHESIRGQGSYRAALAGVYHLLRAGLAVTLNVTLSRLNAGRMQEMVMLASGLGVQRLGFSRFVPSGRGMEMVGEMLEPAEVKALYEALLPVKVPGLEIVTGDPVAAQMRAAPGNPQECIPYGGCAAAVAGLTLLADGTVTPCRRLEMPIGNLRTDSLREIWAASPVLAQLRDKQNYGGKCGSCSRWASCRGCRAIAWAYARSKGRNDFLAEDPQCFLEI
ncbi:MAG: radical SAM protein [Geobacter sp.]|nr:radical SAM protein [Geobacter sp.]